MKPNRFFYAAIVVLLIAFCCVPSFAQNQMTVQQKELAEYIQDKYTKREVLIPMRDGVRLFTSVYEPKRKSEKYPIMLNRTPYTVAPYGKDKEGKDQFKTSLGPDELFAREGYIFVYQDVRGRWKSEGEFADVRPDIENRTPQQIDESTDTFDTVEWLIKNLPNNNGRVGIYGISYPGFYTSAGIIDTHPAIKAASPQAPVSDWFHGDDMHHNGALFLAQNFNFFDSFGQARPQPVQPSTTALKPFEYGMQDGYKYFLQMGGLKNSGELYQKQLGERIKFWDEMMAHPNYDQFWKDRNILPKLQNIKTAVMTVGGWFDNEDLYGALETYRHIERQNPGIYNVLVVGPWFHGGWARSDGDWLGTAYFGQKTGIYYRETFEVPFFNYYLKDKGSIAQIKEVNVFDTGSNDWKSFSTYNPTNVTETPIYLAANGKLSFTKPPAADGGCVQVSRTLRRCDDPRGAIDEYVSDPSNPVPYTQKITLNYPRDFMTEDQRFAATRPDVLTYQTEPLTRDITVAGDIKPNLFVSSTGTDSDFIVKLIDVFPDDYQYPTTGKTLPNGQPERVKPPENSAWSVFQPGGYQMLLRGEPMPARFRNSFERPEPLKPNVPAKVAFVMPGITHTFKKGHRIMVQIQSTWFPLVARNPQKFMANYKLATDADFQKVTERIYRSGANASNIVLPILK